jgi:hypothetical protein
VSSTDTITYSERWTSDLMNSSRCPFFVAMESIAFVIKFTSTCWSWVCSPLILGSRSFKGGLNDDPICPQFVAKDGQGSLDDIVDVKRSAGPHAHLEMRPDIFDYGVRSVCSGLDAPECFHSVINVRFNTIKPTKSRASTSQDRCQWLFDFVGN